MPFAWSLWTASEIRKETLGKYNRQSSGPLLTKRILGIQAEKEMSNGEILVFEVFTEEEEEDIEAMERLSFLKGI